MMSDQFAGLIVGIILGASFLWMIPRFVEMLRLNRQIRENDKKIQANWRELERLGIVEKDTHEQK